MFVVSFIGVLASLRDNLTLLKVVSGRLRAKSYVFFKQQSVCWDASVKKKKKKHFYFFMMIHIHSKLKSP